MFVQFKPDLTNPNELLGDSVVRACWYAYNAGKNNECLKSVGFSGCEEFQNFRVILEINEGQ
jgi:hypothetical protein